MGEAGPPAIGEALIHWWPSGPTLPARGLFSPSLFLASPSPSRRRRRRRRRPPPSPEPAAADLRRYVKSRLPGGFAAQSIFGTGRRKCAIARVVLQEGTGKVIINYRDAKVESRASLLDLEPWRGSGMKNCSAQSGYCLL
ncbi:hypothetical protein NL676_025753 [Syzygium grande]|nr:hypothetical protein NL676_025753 [Syzygium grande]